MTENEKNVEKYGEEIKKEFTDFGCKIFEKFDEAAKEIGNMAAHEKLITEMCKFCGKLIVATSLLETDDTHELLKQAGAPAAYLMSNIFSSVKHFFKIVGSGNLFKKDINEDIQNGLSQIEKNLIQEVLLKKLEEKE